MGLRSVKKRVFFEIINGESQKQNKIGFLPKAMIRRPALINPLLMLVRTLKT